MLTLFLTSASFRVAWNLLCGSFSAEGFRIGNRRWHLALYREDSIWDNLLTHLHEFFISYPKGWVQLNRLSVIHLGILELLQSLIHYSKQIISICAIRHSLSWTDGSSSRILCGTQSLLSFLGLVGSNTAECKLISAGIWLALSENMICFVWLVLFEIAICENVPMFFYVSFGY